MNVNSNVSLNNELVRKSIHLFSSAIPITYYFLFERNTEIYILILLALASVLIDILRNKNIWFSNLYLKFFNPILRKHERGEGKIMLTGATYVAIAFLLCVIAFPKPVAVTSMLILSISDSFAAIIGKAYGRHYVSSKTIEGSAAFFVTGMIVIMITPKMTDSISEYALASVAVLVTTLFELIPLKIDDNIVIPMFFGITYLLLFKTFI